MANENRTEQIDRVRLMAEGDDQWDLSDNDLAALNTVLQDRGDLFLALQNILLATELHGAHSRQFFDARNNGLKLIRLIAKTEGALPSPRLLEIANARAKAEGSDA